MRKEPPPAGWSQSQRYSFRRSQGVILHDRRGRTTIDRGPGAGNSRAGPNAPRRARHDAARCRNFPAPSMSYEAMLERVLLVVRRPVPAIADRAGR